MLCGILAAIVLPQAFWEGLAAIGVALYFLGPLQLILLAAAGVFTYFTWSDS